MKSGKPYLKLTLSGLMSGVLYLLLYLYSAEIMASFTRTDGWYPALPILTAFAFSLAHGAFAGYFWEVLRVSARTRGR